MINDFKTIRLESDNKSNPNLVVLTDKSDFNAAKVAVSKATHRCVIIVDQEGKFLNVITQGDIIRFELKSRRPSLRGLLQDKASAKVALNSSSARKIALLDDLDVVPIINLDNSFQGILVRRFNSKSSSLNSLPGNRVALILAGGKGTRLGAITKNTPKPLLAVGGMPLIEHVMTSIEFLGYQEFYLLCGHLLNEFQAFSKKTRFNVKICAEDAPLGTGGPLIKWVHDNESRIQRAIESDGVLNIFIANGDLLFDIEPHEVAAFEQSNKKFGIVGRQLNTQIKFGTMILGEEGILSEFVEKPVVKHIVNTGIYCISLDNHIFSTIKKMKPAFVGMPDLFQLISKEVNEDIFIIKTGGNYLDLGTPDDLSKFRNLMEKI